MRKHHCSSAQTGLAPRFIRNFEGPYLVVRHPLSDRSDLLILRHLSTGKELSHPVNVKQLVVVPDRDIIDVQSDNDAVDREKGRQRERERQRQTQTQRQRQREKKRETEREKKRETETETET